MPNNSLRIEYVSVAELRDNAHSARRHSKKKIAQLANSIRRLGFNVPLIIDKAGNLLAGHARLAAAKLEGMDEVPVIRVTHFSDLEARAFMVADNKFGLNATWDYEVLAVELQELVEHNFDAVVTGFSEAEIDFTICTAEEAKAIRSVRSPENLIPEPPNAVVTEPGDIWELGRHRLLCGDARDPAAYLVLMGSEKAHMVFTDPPYNCPIPGHVSGLGKVKHENFAMACGEMSDEAFSDFLRTTLGLAAHSCRDGAIAFACMDWRQLGLLMNVGREVFSELKNLVVWNKMRGGMGACYRSQHELICMFKVGTAPHTNNFGLGETGRYRTNVWDYPGVSGLTSSGAEALEMHPTVKPVLLVEDACKDCSRRGDIILDPFGGSGTTLIAAHKCGRVARLIEFDRRYCDTIIARYEKYTGKRATLASTSQTFDQVAQERAATVAGEAA